MIDRLQRALILSLTAVALSAPVGADEPSLRLPKGLRADWVLGPGPAFKPSARLLVDRGKVWVLAQPHAMVSSDGKGLVLEDAAQDLGLDASGRLYISTDRAAGTLKPDKKLRSASLQVKLLLPSPAWRLADGGSHGMLAYGSDPEDGQAKALRLRDRRALFQWPGRILGIQSTPKGLVVAGSEGLSLLADDGRITPLAFPRAARSMAYVQGAGLAVATEDGAWLLPLDKGPTPFLSAPGLRLRAEGPILYALMPAQGGVLRLRGLEALLP
jgi:hypothetical protein